MLTYKQIEQIEKYLSEINDLSDIANIDSEDLYDESFLLGEKIEASNVGYKNNTPDWSSCYTCFNGVTEYFDYAILQALSIMKAALTGILDSIPHYAKICEIRKDIIRGKNISNLYEQHKFIAEISVKYEGQIDFGKTVQDLISHSYQVSAKINSISSCFNGVISRLEFYLNETALGNTSVRQHASDDRTTHINVVQANNQSVSQSVEVSFDNCIKDLEDCETLKEEELNEIKEQLAQIQEMLQDKKGKKIKIRDKISALLKWTADKATDVMIALLPLIKPHCKVCNTICTNVQKSTHLWVLLFMRNGGADGTCTRVPTQDYLTFYACSLLLMSQRKESKPTCRCPQRN